MICLARQGAKALTRGTQLAGDLPKARVELVSETHREMHEMRLTKRSRNALDRTQMSVRCARHAPYLPKKSPANPSSW